MHFPGGRYVVILDFMSKIRSFPFVSAISSVLSVARSVCFLTAFDSYQKLSIKSGERLCRSGGLGSAGLGEITAVFPCHSSWISPTNKMRL